MFCLSSTEEYRCSHAWLLNCEGDVGDTVERDWSKYQGRISQLCLITKQFVFEWKCEFAAVLGETNKLGFY